jgi:hypothetical protein
MASSKGTADPAAPAPPADTMNPIHAATLISLRAEMVAAMDTMRGIFDRLHDLIHDVKRD